MKSQIEAKKETAATTNIQITKSQSKDDRGKNPPVDNILRSKSNSFPNVLLEQSLWLSGFSNVAGLDEAGRGPWAGPVTAGAVVIHSPKQVVGLVQDSKRMSKTDREEAYELIKQVSSAWGVGVVSAEEIDSIGIQKSVQKAMGLALQQCEESLGKPVDHLIIDGKNVLLIDGYPQIKMNKGDLLHYSIAAASIIAKVHRDTIMVELSQQYSMYGFEKHMGYGTKLHQEMLKKYGPSPIHRKSYRPISDLL